MRLWFLCLLLFNVAVACLPPFDGLTAVNIICACMCAVFVVKE